MSFKVIDKKLLKKYTKIWNETSSLMNIEIDSDRAYGDSHKYLKTKIKSYGDKVKKIFQGNKIPKENVSYKYFYREECKYKIKKNKMEILINDNLGLSSSVEK